MGQSPNARLIAKLLRLLASFRVYVSQDNIFVKKVWRIDNNGGIKDKFEARFLSGIVITLK